MLINVLLQSPAKIKWRQRCIGSANLRHVVFVQHFNTTSHITITLHVRRRWERCRCDNNIRTFPSSLCVMTTHIIIQNMIFFLSSPHSTALSLFEDICSLEKCTMQDLFWGMNTWWSSVSRQFPLRLGDDVIKWKYEMETWISCCFRCTFSHFASVDTPDFSSSTKSINVLETLWLLLFENWQEEGGKPSWWSTHALIC